MRLALIRQRYTPYGGAERFIEGALEALLERNVAITLYTREWPQTNLQLIEPHICNPFYLGSLWRDWGFARAVSRAVGTTKANLVQSHERVLCCDIYRAGDGVHAVWLEERLRGASALARLKVALNPWHRYTLAMERKLFESPWLRTVICNSKMVRDEIKARFHLHDERLPVIYSAVDSVAFHPGLREHRERVRARYKIPADATLFLLVGSGYERKGVATAIAALAELPESAYLMVVGREKRINRYKRLARSLGVRERIAFVGPQLDVKPFYGCADVFVLPTIYDPFPNAALEAMACALPVITTTKSGAAELVTEHDAGLVCTSRDARGARRAHAHAAGCRNAEPAGRQRQARDRAADALGDDAEARAAVQGIAGGEHRAPDAAQGAPRGRAARRPRRPRPTPAREAPPLHGEDGLANETLPPPPSAADKPPLL